MGSPRSITYLDGWRHEALKHAARLARPLEEFDKVVAVARNPYDLEVSRYTFFRRPDSVAPADEKRLAVDSDLEGFVRGSRWFGVPDGHPADYYTVDGAMPGNLDVVRFESLQDDLRRVLSELGVDAERPLPWKNRTRHASWSDSLTPGAEEAIYERWRFLFDTGLYGRVGTE